MSPDPKPGACLISTGASTILNERDAGDAIRSGQLGGLAVDGFVYEPAPHDSPLLKLARERPCGNIVLTPHIAGGIASNDVAARAREFGNIVSLAQGQTLRHRVA